MSVHGWICKQSQHCSGPWVSVHREICARTEGSRPCSRPLPMPFVGSGRWCSLARRVGWGRSDSLGSVQPRSLLSSSEGLAQLRAAEGRTLWPPDAVSKQR